MTIYSPRWNRILKVAYVTLWEHNPHDVVGFRECFRKRFRQHFPDMPDATDEEIATAVRKSYSVVCKFCGDTFSVHDTCCREADTAKQCLADRKSIGAEHGGITEH
jgi:hypothetical protein